MKLKELKEKLDINTHMPGYINKNVFRIAFFILILLAVYISYDNNFDFSPKAYAECPENAARPCINPFYYCTHPARWDTIHGCPVMKRNIGSNDYSCENNLCDVEYLQPGEIVGDKPTNLEREFGTLILVILVLAFVLNHYLYEKKTLFKKGDKDEES